MRRVSAFHVAFAAMVGSGALFSCT